MNQRQKIVQKQFLNNEETVIKRLDQVYKKSLSDIQDKIKNLQFDIGRLQTEYDWMDPKDPERAKVKSQIQAKIYQKQYQEQLQRQIEGILKQMQAQQYLTVSEYLDGCYTDGFVGTIFDLSGQGVPLMMPINQESMVHAVQLDSKISKGLYTRLGEDVDLLKKKITAQISRSIATGETYAQTAKQLAGYTSIGYNNAIRIARTEGHRIQTTAQMDAMHGAKDRGADLVKQWDAALDARTRDSHVKVDGEWKEIDEKFSNGLRYPGDPHGAAAEVINCRCALLQRARWALADGFTKMDGFTGEIKSFDSTETYNEFKEAYFSPENKAYMKYVGELEERYGKDFNTILSKMTDDEYSYFSKLEKARPQFSGMYRGDSVVQRKIFPASVVLEAKTIEEAEALAKNMGVKYVCYSKLPLETANGINRAIETLPDDILPVFVGDSRTLEQYWGGNLPRSSKHYYGVTIDTFDGIHLGIDESLGKYKVDFDTNGQMVGISSSYKTFDKITEAKRTAQLRYQQKHNGQKWFFNDYGEATPFHEMGHIYANAKGIPNGFEADAIRWARESGCDMLKNTAEAWAEAWGAYYTKNPNLPDYIGKYIEKIAENNSNYFKNGLIFFDDDGIISQKRAEFKKDFADGKISTLISPQKQARHIKGSKQFNEYITTLVLNGDNNLPSYIREELKIEDLERLVVGKLKGNVRVNADGSFEEFIMCDEIIGYYYSPSKGKYIPTRCAQIKYSLGKRNIHIIPVKEKVVSIVETET